MPVLKLDHRFTDPPVYLSVGNFVKHV